MNLPCGCRLPSVVCLMMAILLVPGVRAGSLDLAVRGRAPEYAIVRAADASPSVKYAAEELRDFTERMTGVRLPIVTDEGPLPPKAIILGYAARGAPQTFPPRLAAEHAPPSWRLNGR